MTTMPTVSEPTYDCDNCPVVFTAEERQALEDGDCIRKCKDCEFRSPSEGDEGAGQCATN